MAYISNYGAGRYNSGYYPRTMAQSPVLYSTTSAYLPPYRAQPMYVEDSRMIVQQPVVYGSSNNTGLIILACFVMWCFGFIFGFIAFILAMNANDGTRTPEYAKQLRRASLWISIAGIIVPCIVVIIIMAIVFAPLNYGYG